MFFKQFHLESLGHASYLVGDEKTGKALVLDARRDVDDYFDAARANGLHLSYAIDTHGHNDYLSGLSELRARQEIEVLAYRDAEVGYPNRPVADGEIVEMGDVAFEVVHTPGHTPEHVSLLVYDRHAGDEPAVMLSGGAVLVGDLARPDLLGGQEEAGKPTRTLAQMTVHELHERMAADGLSVVDVRQPAEWSARHIAGATFITGAELPERADDVTDGPIAVICGGGYRSSVMASLLQRHGRSDVAVVTGGMAAWKAAGYPTESEASVRA